MLLENESLACMRDKKSEYVKSEAPDPINKGECHQDLITGLCMAEFPDERRFVTASRDGTVRLWHPHTLTTIDSFSVSKSWSTAIAYMGGCGRIAVATADRRIGWYECLQSGVWALASEIKDLHGVVLCLDVIKGRNDGGEREGLLCGDDKGCLTYFEFTRGWHICHTEMKCSLKKEKDTHWQYIAKKKLTEIKRYVEEKNDSTLQRLTRDHMVMSSHLLEGVEIVRDFANKQKPMKDVGDSESVLSQRSEKGKGKNHEEIGAWFNKVKWISDLADIVVCASDGKIHFWKIEKTLRYKEEAVLHKKGVNTFI